MTIRYWGFVLAGAGVVAALALAGDRPAQAIDVNAAVPPAGSPAGLADVALIPGDAGARSVWHAQGSRLRRCTLEGTDAYRCGPWQ